MTMIYTPVFIDDNDKREQVITGQRSFTDRDEAKQFARSQHRLYKKAFINEMEPETLSDMRMYAKHYNEFNSYIIVESELK